MTTETIKIEKDEQLLINSINNNLPAIPIVVDLVNRAIEISKKHLSGVKRNFDTEDTIYLHSLRVALEVAKHIKETGNDLFFNYDPIIVALLHDLLEDAEDIEEAYKDLEIFRTSDGKIKNSVEALTNCADTIKSTGRTKYMVLKFVNLFNESKDLFLVKVLDRIDNLNCLKVIKDTEQYKTDSEYGDMFITNYLLETQVVHLNLQLSNLVVPLDIYKHYNKLLTFIISDFVY